MLVLLNELLLQVIIKTVKEYKTQVDIMRIAVEHLETDFKSEEVNDD